MPLRSLASVRCPQCDVAVELSGGSFIIAGLGIAVFCAFVLDDIIPLLGTCVGGVIMGLGIMRVIRQFLAIRKSRNL